MRSRRNRALAALAVLAAIVLAAGPARAQQDPGDDQKARELFRLGEGHYAAGRYEKAAVLYDEAYRLSGRAELLLAMANTYERMGDYPQAIRAAQRVPRSSEGEERRLAARPAAPPGAGAARPRPGTPAGHRSREVGPGARPRAAPAATAAGGPGRRGGRGGPGAALAHAGVPVPRRRRGRTGRRGRLRPCRRPGRPGRRAGVRRGRALPRLGERRARLRAHLLDPGRRQRRRRDRLGRGRRLSVVEDARRDGRDPQRAAHRTDRPAGRTGGGPCRRSVGARSSRCGSRWPAAAR